MFEIDKLKTGDDGAFTAMWHEQQPRLVSYAERFSHRVHGKSMDAEGAVQSAMLSFWKRLRDRRIAFDDQNELMAILVTLVRRKLTRQLRAAFRKKRGGIGKSVPLDTSNLQHLAASRSLIDQIHPEYEAEAREEFGRLLHMLQDETLQQIVVLKLEGQTHDEIARRTCSSRATIVRKLGMIRQIWLSAASA